MKARFRVVRRKVKCCVQRLHACVWVSGIDLEAAEVDERADVLLVELEAFPVGGLGLGCLAAIVQDGAKRQVEAGVIWLQLYRPARQLLCFGQGPGLAHFRDQFIDLGGGGGCRLVFGHRAFGLACFSWRQASRGGEAVPGVAVSGGVGTSELGAGGC